jgi:hypothetical protein
VVRPPYATVLRLTAVAEAYWPQIDAAYLSVDLLRLPEHRFYNAVYTWTIERIDPDKREEWIQMLNEPLEGTSPREPTPSQVEAEGASFMAFMGEHQQMKAGV